MDTAFTMVLAATFVASAAWGTWSLWDAMQLRYVESSPARPNADNVAKGEFLRLLQSASVEMIVYNDGNRITDSIYDQPEIVEAVKEKLLTHPEFTMRCLFNEPDGELLFMKEFRTSSSVEIKRRKRDVAPHPTHYKIIDGGRRAYLSKHVPGSSERRYKLVDCTQVPKKRLPRVSGVVLGKHLRYFDQTFAAS